MLGSHIPKDYAPNYTYYQSSFPNKLKWPSENYNGSFNPAENTQSESLFILGK